MFDIDVAGFDADQTLADISTLQRLSNLIAARMLQDAAHWADLHAVLEHSIALPGGERTRVQAGEIKVWAARRIVQAGRHLPRQAAGRVDRVVAPYADRKNASEPPPGDRPSGTRPHLTQPEHDRT